MQSLPESRIPSSYQCLAANGGPLSGEAPVASIKLSAWLQAAFATKTVTEGQIRSALANAVRVKRIGLVKTPEEILIIMGCATRDQWRAVARRVRAEKRIECPEPRVFPISTLSDSEVLKAWGQVGPDGGRKIEECRDIQRELNAAGLPFPLWEIAEARGCTLPPKPRMSESDVVFALVQATTVRTAAPSKTETTKLWITADRRRAMAPPGENPQQQLIIGVAVGAVVLVLGFTLILLLS